MAGKTKEGAVADPLADVDVPAGAVQMVKKKRVRPSDHFSVPRQKKFAETLIKEAATLKEGERKCRTIKKTGEPCKNYAIKGGFVCMYHGGSAPQVRKKANRRLLAMVEPSIIRLEALIHQNEHLPTALGAIKTVLERAEQPIGALKSGGEVDSRPIVQVNILPGGVPNPTKPEVTVMPMPAGELPPMVEAEILP